MLNLNAQYYEWLLPYLEGGLDEARQAQLEARLAADPALAAEAERLRQTLGGLRGVSARTPRPDSAQVPADLWPHLRARLVLEPAPRPRARAWWVAGLGAPAAAALIVAAFWLPGWHTPTQPALSPKPSAISKTAPFSPAPPAVPRAMMVTPIRDAKPSPTAKIKPTAKTDGAIPKPAPVLTQLNPFALSAPPAPVKTSADGQLTTPVVPAPAGKPSVLALRPPTPVASIAPRRQGGAVVTNPAPSVLSASTSLPPAAPKTAAPPLMPSPPAPTVTLNGQNAVRPSASGRATATAGLGGFGGGSFGGGAGFGGGGFGGGGFGTRGTAPGTAPRETLNSTSTAQLQAKSAPPVSQPSSGMFALIPPKARRDKMAQRFAAPKPPDDGLQAFDTNGPASLDSWQATLSAAVQTPLWGENAGEMQANQALMAAREAGMLEDLRARLEARRASSPHDLVTGRMLAAVYEFGFSTEAALHERHRVVTLDGAGGEDWFALAQAEEHAGNGSAARAAYRRSLASLIPPSAFHAAIAHGRS